MTGMERNTLVHSAAITSVAVAAVLIVSKVIAWRLSGSVSLLSSLLDSSLDASASLLNLWAVRQAAKPADNEHRFGHGKAEPLAGMGQTLLIGASAMLLLTEALPRLMNPQPVKQAGIGVAVMLLSIVLTLALVSYQRYVIRRTRSVAISADSLHYAGDLLMNASIIVALTLSSILGWHVMDPIFAIAISAYVLYTAWRIARASIDILMDRELPDEERERIEEIARAEPGVLGLHDVRTRSSGLQRFVQLHLELSGDLTLNQAHRIADGVADRVRAEFEDAEVIIHQDPVDRARN